MSTELMEFQTVTVTDLYQSDGSLITKILDETKQAVESYVPDTSTTKGRKEIASFASKISKGKVFLDGLGKDHVSGLKAQAKTVDVERKRLRDGMDERRDLARQPLTLWEAEEEEKVQAEMLRAEKERNHEDALELDVLFTLRKDAEARLIKENAEKAELEREERDKLIAEQAVWLEKELAKRREQKIKDDAERKIKLAEFNQKAERAAELQEKARQDRLARNKNHRARIAREAMIDLEAVLDHKYDNLGQMVDSLFTVIAEGEIRHIGVHYGQV